MKSSARHSDSTGTGLEQFMGAVIGSVALVPVAVILMLIVIAGKFQTLQQPTAWEHAQLARHLAEGDGFVTSVVRPLSLVFKPQVPNHPDLYNAPGHPLAEAIFFRVFGSSDKIAALAGAVLWLVSVWLTFLIARSWFGTGAAAL